MWLDIYQIINKVKRTEKKLEDKILKEVFNNLKNSFEYFWGEEAEETSYHMKENFVEIFETTKENDQKRKLQSDTTTPFFFINKKTDKKLILCGLNLEKEEPKLNWFLRKNKKYEIENFKTLIELNKGKSWLSNLLKTEETLILFGLKWKDEIPKGIRFSYKFVGLENGNRNSIPFGLVNQVEKHVENKKKIKTKLISENSVENRKKDEIIIQFTTHEIAEQNEIEAIFPTELFIEKEGIYRNLFLEKIETKKLKGIDIDRMLKNFFRDWEIYEDIKNNNFLSEKDIKKAYQFEPLSLYKTEYLIKIKSDLLLEKIKHEIKIGRSDTFSYLKYIREKDELENIEKFKIKEFETKKTYLKNKREEEKKLDKLTIYSQTEYEFYKRHLLPEEKKNYK